MSANDYKKWSGSRGNLIVPLVATNTVEAWVRALIKDVFSSPMVEDVAPKAAPSLDIALAKNDPNPYIRARAEVLSKLKKSAQENIIKIEKDGKTDDKFYKEFTKQVQTLGDKLSDEVKKPLDKTPKVSDNPANN